eukprot:jgi/Astpho2/2326/e_gw1.00043.32.1_t
MTWLQVHWDHLMEEMAWMGKEFARERRWKMTHAKRFAGQIKRSNLDVESRQQVRAKEELQALRKQAAFVGKEVMQFWRKAERVVEYKRRTVLDAHKREAMDKHLDFLVGQTQRYSTLLAQRLGAPTSKRQQARQQQQQQANSDSPAASGIAPASPAGTATEAAADKATAAVPFLLKGSLREYQHVGLEWLITIYTRRLNGILADEMGLGKTIMTIAVLAHLACELGVWGPHLIVVPTSVMLNWEMEFKKWCPAFKLLTYYGSAKERKLKRQGWSKPNAFHVCITSYTLVLQDAKMFRRKKWKYLILDEAHMIKNWKSQRWQTLLNFNSKRRLLITGTPLQNDLMELWSLMHFLMPQVFASHAQFKDWFHNPLTGMVEGQTDVNQEIVERLHSVLRPFLLRRLKADVEKQLPGKHEHVIRCRLSKRQRTLYEDYMDSSDTTATLASGNFLGIINVLMQLRKVCNHPDLFEGRPIVSAFDAQPLDFQLPSLATQALQPRLWVDVSLAEGAIGLCAREVLPAWGAAEVQVRKCIPKWLQRLSVVISRCLQLNMHSTSHSAVLTTDHSHSCRVAHLLSPAGDLVWARGSPCTPSRPPAILEARSRALQMQQEYLRRSALLRAATVRRQLFFPDRRLLQFDCGKLQELAALLRTLKAGGHKALIFTQMTKMLDILENFLNLHGYAYVRLDGSTKPEQRQILMQRFNTNPKLFVFILSTRSGGVGMNLTGADTVIFYDSDWNPAMDAQAQDRCHRIGQTREVHIYRLVSEKTIEENILSKSDQKRQLDHLAIQSGGFNT